MTWWEWALLGWFIVAVVVGVLIGRAIRNADEKEETL